MQDAPPREPSAPPDRTARPLLLPAFLGVVLWVAWFLPPLDASFQPTSTGEIILFFATHVLPIATLLLVPILGREATYLAWFPLALVVPFATSAVTDWPLLRARAPGDVLIGAAAFALYAIAVPILLRRARARPLTGRVTPVPSASHRTRGWLGRARVALVVGLPIALLYATIFDRRLQIVLADSFGAAQGYAQVMLALAALGLGALAAELAFFAPLRATRKLRAPADFIAGLGPRFAVRSRPSRLPAMLAVTAVGIAAVVFAAYLAARG